MEAPVAVEHSVSARRRALEAAQLPEASVVWFTGLSGAGKSTIARGVLAELERRAVRYEALDGDVIRDIFPATGFTQPERDAHIRRVGWLASRLEHHGVFVIASLVSPYEASRQFVRGLCHNFIEVYVATSLAECERRDVKGLYARARRGEIAHFTGIDDPYEPPGAPELTLDTAKLSVPESVDAVLERMGFRTEGL
jgi:adenylylsulfate kinase